MTKLTIHSQLGIQLAKSIRGYVALPHIYNMRHVTETPGAGAVASNQPTQAVQLSLKASGFPFIGTLISSFVSLYFCHWK